MTTSTSEQNIVIQDVGPNRHLEIPLPAGGGVVVLQARNDVGKSEALQAVEALVTRDGSIDKREGAISGQVSLGEARITVTKASRRSGTDKLAVVSIEGGSSALADLVEPHLKNAEAADMSRSKALVRMSGVPADPSLFYEVVGGKEAFDHIVRPDVLTKIADPVDMASVIKREIEAKAREIAANAQREAGAAQAHRNAGAGYDPAVETDQEELDMELHASIREHSAIQQRAHSAVDNSDKVERAREQLEAAKRSYAGPSLEDCQRNVEANERIVSEAESTLRELRVDLAREQAMFSKARTHFNLIAGWQETIDQAAETGLVPEQEVTAAADRATRARQAVEQGALNRDKKGRVKLAETAEKEAHRLGEESRRLRACAQGGLDAVLSGMVAQLGSGLRFEHSRLVIDDERDGEKRVVPYSELSDGRRWKLAIDICVEALARAGKPKLIVLPQVAWSEIDPINRREIDQHCKQRSADDGEDCHLLTAEATADEEIVVATY